MTSPGRSRRKHSRGLAAVAVAGHHAWEPARAGLLAGRHAAVVMEGDPAGRIAAARVAGDLQAAGAIARMVDLAPGRDDGWDLTDWLAERASDPPARLLAALRLLVSDRPASGRVCTPHR